MVAPNSLPRSTLLDTFQEIGYSFDTGFHRTWRISLQIQANQRLGIRRSQVEPPIVIVEGYPVERRKSAIAEMFLDATYCVAGIGNFEIDFSGMGILA